MSWLESDVLAIISNYQKDLLGVHPCPRCGKYEPLKALSRRDNQTIICSACGTSEAFEDAGMADLLSVHDWWFPVHVIRAYQS